MTLLAESALADLWRLRAQQLAEQGAGDYLEGSHVSGRDYLTPQQLARQIIDGHVDHDRRENCCCEICMPAVERKLIQLLGPGWFSDYRRGRRTRSIEELAAPALYLVPPPCELCGARVLNGALLCPECLGQETTKTASR